MELKFNCFFLMPVVDAFPTRLREELEAAYEEDLDDVFDVAAVRAALEFRLKSLESELHQVCESAMLYKIWKSTPFCLMWMAVPRGCKQLLVGASLCGVQTSQWQLLEAIVQPGKTTSAVASSFSQLPISLCIWA